LSVIVKCYNEAAKIDLCLRSIIAEASPFTAEVILVDSLSTDRSVEVARAYPIRIVQLADPADRRCGAVAQLGYQLARGQFLLLIDGDMELLPGFLEAALTVLQQNERIAGVGGKLIETSTGMEFQERERRDKKGFRAGEVKRLGGCALYRRAAIDEVRYFMNRNLHCFEEFELGLRLRSHGWRMWMLDIGCVRHHGHSDSSLRLLVKRWRTRFFHGYGELLRNAWRRPYFLEATAPCRLAVAVIVWWATLVSLAIGAAFSPWAGFALPMVAILPWLALIARKRSISRAAYTFLVWQFAAASLIAGLLAQRVQPTEAIAAVTIKGEEAVALTTSGNP
jgi:glycosyltransferase involved in cell wall biosynthesis